MTGVRTEFHRGHIVKARHISEDDVERLRQDRNPCARCGTRMDYHDTLGCKRFVAEVVA